MKKNERVPAFVLAVAFVLGIVSGLFFSPPFWLQIILAILFFSASIIFFLNNNSMAFSIIVLFAMVFAGLLRYETHTRMIPPDSIVNLESGKEYIIEGTVSEQPIESGEKVKFKFDAEKAKLPGTDSFKNVSGKIMTYYYGDKKLEYGDVIRIETDLPIPGQATNFYAFDYRDYLNRNGIFRVAYVYEHKLEKLDLSGGSPLYEYIIYPVRNHIEYVVSNTLKGDIAGFLEGILLGGGKKMAQNTHDKFVEVGVVHILAVSGLHVGILALLFYTIFSTLFHLSRKWTTIFTIIVLILYVILTRMRPSVMRATLMISIVLSGQIFGRKPRLMNSMGIAAIFLLAINPSQILDLGFQLSFGATFGIVYLYPRLMEMLPEKWQNNNSFIAKYGLQAALVSVCAQLGTFPIITMNFHRVPLLSIFANLIVVPTIAFAVPIGILTVFTGLFSIGLARIFAAANWVILKFIMVVVDFFAQFELANVAFPHFGFWFVILFYIVLITGVNAKRSKLALKIFLILLISITTVFASYNFIIKKPELWIVFLDVGQGDSIYIKYPNGRTMLIDAGFPKSYDYVIEPFIMAQGRKSVDEILVTHAHYDHFGGFVPFYEKMYSEEFLATFSKRKGMLYNKLLENVSNMSVRLDTIRAGDTLTDIYPVRGKFLWPDSTVIDSDGNTDIHANDVSTVLLIKYGDAEIMLSGDAEEHVEHLLFERYGDSLKCDIYKAAHHGSKTSNTAEFVRALSPDLAVVCVGEKNKFNHPAPSTMQRLDSLGCLLYRTDKDGAVWVKTDGKKIWGETRLGKKFSFSAID
ncbi:MAG: DNA internalization-related competence protein ComEC/Rec2 [Candidatus Zixiibacteriota bacterium]